MSGQDPLGALASIAGKAWLVGGALRDRLLGRVTATTTLPWRAIPRRWRGRCPAGPADTHSCSRRGSAAGGWSRGGATGRWTSCPSQRGGSRTDLAARDFTINALALPIASLADGGAFAGIVDSAEVIDPFGGVPDLHERRLRMVSQDGFERDPLRVLRLARLKCELSFAVDGNTREAARRSARNWMGGRGAHLRRVQADRLL